MEPDDPGEPVARDVFRLQADLDLEGLVVHLDQPAAEVVAVPRADQVGGRIPLLHPGKRQQAFAFRLAEPDGRRRPLAASSTALTLSWGTNVLGDSEVRKETPFSSMVVTSHGMTSPVRRWSDRSLVGVWPG